MPRAVSLGPAVSANDGHHPDTVQRGCLTAVGTRRTGLAATSVAWNALQLDLSVILPRRQQKGGGGDGRLGPRAGNAAKPSYQGGNPVPTLV